MLQHEKKGDLGTCSHYRDTSALNYKYWKINTVLIKHGIVFWGIKHRTFVLVTHAALFPFQLHGETDAFIIYHSMY